MLLSTSGFWYFLSGCYNYINLYFYDAWDLFYLQGYTRSIHIFYILMKVVLCFVHLLAPGISRICLILKMLSYIFCNSHFSLQIIYYLFIFYFSFSHLVYTQDLNLGLENLLLNIHCIHKFDTLVGQSLSFSDFWGQHKHRPFWICQYAYKLCSTYLKIKYIFISNFTIMLSILISWCWIGNWINVWLSLIILIFDLLFDLLRIMAMAFWPMTFRVLWLRIWRIRIALSWLFSFICLPRLIWLLIGFVRILLWLHLSYQYI